MKQAHPSPAVPSAAVRIVAAAFRRKQAANPAYSRRALARDLGVSPAFVSNMLRGRKGLPRRRLDDLSRLLELDVHERSSLLDSVVMDCPGTRELLRLDPAFRRIGSRQSIELGRTGPSLLSRWWNIAVLEGLSLRNEIGAPERLRRRLGLSAAQWLEAVRCLAELGLVETIGGVLRKKTDHHYVPTGRSKLEVRRFHAQMIELARQEMLTRTGDRDFHRRLITGFTFPLDPTRREAMKGKILAFLDELSRDAQGEECSEVYQCNVQFFPLTREG